MATADMITTAQLSHLTGAPDAPVVIDVRIAEDQPADPRALRASLHRDNRSMATWAAGFLAASLGLSRIFRKDLTELGADMLLYDAFSRQIFFTMLPRKPPAAPCPQLTSEP